MFETRRSVGVAPIQNYPPVLELIFGRTPKKNVIIIIIIIIIITDTTLIDFVAKQILWNREGESSQQPVYNKHRQSSRLWHPSPSLLYNCRKKVLAMNTIE